MSKEQRTIWAGRVLLVSIVFVLLYGGQYVLTAIFLFMMLVALILAHVKEDNEKNAKKEKES